MIAFLRVPSAVLIAAAVGAVLATVCAVTGSNIMASQKFGNLEYASIWGSLSPILAAVGGLAGTVYGLIRDMSGSYSVVFAFCGAIVVLMLVLTIMITGRPQMEFITPEQLAERRKETK